ncbi:MAG: FHA domain-containing protein [Candidatus Eremiobacterota bacterium]
MLLGLKTDIGSGNREKGNEDNLIALNLHIDKGPDCGEYHILLLADGMGGLDKGEMASALTIRGITKHLINRLVTEKGMFSSPEEPVEPGILLKEAIEMSNLLVYNTGKRDKWSGEMGSTIVAGLIKDGKLFIAHVGDSRAYLIRKDRIEKLTTDHSLVQALYESHLINTSQFYSHPQKNIITRAIGFAPKVEIEINEKRKGKPVTLQENDFILLCSDGLSNVLEEETDILGTVKKHSNNPQLIVNELIELANLRETDDNATVICASIEAKDLDFSRIIPASVKKTVSKKAIQKKVPTVTLSSPVILCHYCGHKNFLGDINCSSCGKPQIFILRKPEIIIIDGPDKGKSLVMERDEMYIGREEDCNDLVIHEPPGREFISRKHLKIFKSCEEYWIEDLMSSNGTKIRGQQIRGKKLKLMDRELIVLGMNTLEFSM